MGVWVCGCVEERISLRCHQVTSKVPKIVKNLLVLQFCSWDGSFGHGEMKIWLCLYFQHVTRYIGTDFVEESRRKMQRSGKETFLAKGALIGKSIFRIQPINAVHGRCSSSGVLRDIPSNFTRSVFLILLRRITILRRVYASSVINISLRLSVIKPKLSKDISKIKTFDEMSIFALCSLDARAHIFGLTLLYRDITELRYNHLHVHTQKYKYINIKVK